MTGRRKALALVGAGLAVLGIGFSAGSRAVQKPKTVVQVVTVKWAADAAPDQRKAALEGVEKVALEFPGVRNIWMRTIRVQPRDFMTAFAIEFEDLPSAERFAHSPAYELWNKSYLPIIEESRSQQVSN
jgi:antibiotic biosynthesis monooxygenase (ABM) superfamily enzyme